MMHDNLKVAFAENKWCASSAVLTAKITGAAVTCSIGLA